MFHRPYAKLAQMWLILGSWITFFRYVYGTPFYYGTYRSYGTGDTVINTVHANGGPNTSYSKWQVECLEGEAVTGIQDFVFDFGGITTVWCKFMFAYKQNVGGVYPYYPNCHVRNFFNEFSCYNPKNHLVTTNTFVTGFWDDDYSFWVYRKPLDINSYYKCCRVPPGYYIDYVSCYYMLSHDQYWEYYDSNFFLLTCATGFALTGISKKPSPINTEFRIEWIQCCRIGYGAVTAQAPPVINTPNGGPTAYSTTQVYNSPPTVPASFAQQYRSKRSTVFNTAVETGKHSMLAEEALPGDQASVSSAFFEGPKPRKTVRIPFDFRTGQPSTDSFM